MSVWREVAFALLYAGIGAVLVFIFRKKDAGDDKKEDGERVTMVDDANGRMIVSGGHSRFVDPSPFLCGQA